MGLISFNEFKGTTGSDYNDLITQVNNVIQEAELFPDAIQSTNNVPTQTTQSPIIPAKTEPIIDSTKYKLYRDKQENFCCEIMIEGANPDSSSVRLIIESPEWNLLFNGTITGI